MEIVVLKFGGSSVADNNKLNIVVNKIKSFYDNNKEIVVVVSAQGKKTDELIKEALSLSNTPNERELDVLLSSGEQMSMAKLAILLNEEHIPAISLTGWQAGIYTNDTNQDAIIQNIDTSRIYKELKQNKVVVVAGFQGINKNNDITTLGRGGSDTTAVALAAKLKASKCYIFSDVDGIYSTDPNQTNLAKKLDTISYKEMLDIADEGAKVLHNRCVEIAEKYGVQIIAQSTFNDSKGTIINDKIEGTYVKSIVKNDNIKYVHIKEKNYSLDKFNELYNLFIKNELGVKNLVNSSLNDLDISFTINKDKVNKLNYILENEFKGVKSSFLDISKISIIGSGIMSNNSILNKIMNIIEKNKLDIISMEINEAKISVMFNKIVSDDILENLHKELI